jgi:hypothetical protein
MRDITTLTQSDYTTLLETGLLFEVFPEATGDWAKDTDQVIGPEDNTVAIHKVTLIVMSLNGDCESEGDVTGALENLRYPEFVDVLNVETKRVEWSDEHPLNREETKEAAIRELFP